MPWTVDNPPAVAKNWSAEKIAACVKAGNAVLAEGGDDEEAIFACIGAADNAGRGEDAMGVLGVPGSERRYLALPVEVREAGEDGGAVITGYGAVFNEWSEDLGGFKELVEPGAFTATLADGPDVRSLWHHSLLHVLGRAGNETLRVWEDERGLRYEVDVPDTSWARDLLVSIRRGDVRDSSFGFRVPEDGDTWSEDNGIARRRLRAVTLYDVGPVSIPAYSGATAEVRAVAAGILGAGSGAEDDAGGDDRVDLIARRWRELREAELRVAASHYGTGV